MPFKNGQLRLKEKVERVLRDEPETRNSDIALTIAIWKRYHEKKLHETKSGRYVVYVDDLFDLPREDNIKRWRAKFQNDMLKYPPTSESVARKRGMNMKVWRALMGPQRLPYKL